MNPLVSIIIPCHNYEKWLVECIASLRSDTYAPKQIIIMHDHCDSTVLHGVDTESWFDRRYGVSYTRNRGFMFARGKYVWFLDADDMAIPGSIAARVRYLEKHPDVGMVWGNARKINVMRGNWGWGYPRCIANLAKLERYSRRLNAQTLLWRRSVLEEHGLYYEKLTSKEDKEMLYRYGIHPDSPLPKLIKAHKLPDDIVIYRRHPKAKHKMRVQNKAWFKDTERDFNKRIEQLQNEGITHANTRFPNGK